MKFIGDDGDVVTVRVEDEHASDEDEAVKRAKAVMIQLTAPAREAAVAASTAATPRATGTSTTTNPNCT